MKTKNNEVIYEIYPLTFSYAAGSKSDPYKGAYGNLKGISAQVDYVKHLGADAIWITPFYPWGSTGFGYDIKDYCQVAPMFGTIEDFKELCDVYHAHGIRVIIDQVYNHCSDQHDWFQKSIQGLEPYKDYFIWHDAKGFDENGKPIEPNNWEAHWNSSGKSAWTWNEQRQQFYLHSFDFSMPDWNINNPKVQEELLKFAKFWLDLGADGFRLDAVLYWGCDPEFKDNLLTVDGTLVRTSSIQSPSGQVLMQKLKKLCNQYPTPKTLLAEYCYNGDEVNRRLARYIIKESPCDAFYTGVLTGSTIEELKQDLTNTLEDVPQGEKINWAISSHDLERAGSRLFGEKHTPAKAKMLMDFLATLPGSICIFQGDELGIVNPKSFDACKSPENDPCNIWANYNAPWDAGRVGFAITSEADDCSRNMSLHPDEEQYALAVYNQNAKDSTLALTRRSISKRKRMLFKYSGNITFIPEVDNPNVLAYVRTFKGSPVKILCVYNFDDKPVKFYYKGKMYKVWSESSLQKQV